MEFFEFMVIGEGLIKEVASNYQELNILLCALEIYIFQRQESFRMFFTGCEMIVRCYGDLQIDLLLIMIF
jgi:hypothetical protein